MTERRGPSPFELDPSKVDPVRIELVPEEDPARKLPAVVPTTKPPGRPWFRLLIGAGSLTVVSLLGLEAYQHLEALYDRSVALGTAFAALYGLTAVGGLGLALQEWLSLRRLTAAESLREKAQSLTGSAVHGHAEPLLRRITRLYQSRSELKPAIRRYEGTVSDAHDDGERLRLYARIVLGPLDREAYQLVKKGGRDIGALTALSPLGLLDSLIVLVRTLMMLRAIARLYGVRPGAMASFRLIRDAARNMLAAGVGELLSDAAVETAGATVLSVLSARAGQGVVNGLLAARLGLSAMQLCRPLPFTEDEMPSLARLRQEIFETKP
ncbi:MAG: TIGR01620 family protein [Geminicoccaceae bacterium]|nr:TIGR01620 family protein [Geminicoccaceae bacterium]